MNDSYKLTEFSPTESLMILHPANPSYSAFIKFSLIELINLRVLETYRDSAGLAQFPNMKYTYIKRGECFYSVDNKTYFPTFTDRFLDKDRHIPIQIYGKTIFSKVKWVDFKDNLVYKILLDKGIYYDTFLSYFNIYLLTDKGKAIKKQLKETLKRLDKAIDNKKDSKIAEISNELGLNVFLSEKINSKTLKELSSAIKSIPNSFNYSDSIFVSSYDFGGFSSFDSSFDSFDSSDFGGGDFGGGGDGGSYD